MRPRVHGNHGIVLQDLMGAGEATSNVRLNGYEAWWVVKGSLDNRQSSGRHARLWLHPRNPSWKRQQDRNQAPPQATVCAWIGFGETRARGFALVRERVVGVNVVKTNGLLDVFGNPELFLFFFDFFRPV